MDLCISLAGPLPLIVHDASSLLPCNTSTEPDLCIVLSDIFFTALQFFETFSYLPPLSNDAIARQVDFIIANGKQLLHLAAALASVKPDCSPLYARPQCS